MSERIPNPMVETCAAGGFVVPALVIGAIGRLLWFGALLAFGGIALNFVVLLEILREMTSHSAHVLKF
jgi:hypothetical protein